jgi:hypothetical protein
MPVGLNGRLLVKIAPDSDPIRPGDFLTTSDIPGRAMKANHAGEVIGKAMDNWDSNSGKDRIIVFIEQGYFNGLSDQVMTGGLSGDAQLTQFIDVSAQNVDVSGILSVDSLKAKNIEGLSIISDEIATLNDQVASLSAHFPSLSNSQASMNSLSEGLATVSGNLQVKGQSIFEGIVNILLELFIKDLNVSGFANFLGNTIFKGNVLFAGKTTFSNDTAGFAVIKKGEKSVGIVFSQIYDNKPVVTASISLDENADATESAVFGSNIQFVITKTTAKGFTIILNNPAAEDISFSWNALPVKDPQTFMNKISQIIEPILTPTVAPASVSTPTPTITQAPQDVIPSVTPITQAPQQDASQSATPTP